MSNLSEVFDNLGKGVLVAGGGVLAFGEALLEAARAAAEEQVRIEQLGNIIEHGTEEEEEEVGK